MNRALGRIMENVCCGRRGIRTPGTVNPYVSLANWWFQPLTHPSIGFVVELPSIVLKCGAKVISLFQFTKYFHNFFGIIVKKAVLPLGLFLPSYLFARLWVASPMLCRILECLSMEPLLCPDGL